MAGLAIAGSPSAWLSDGASINQWNTNGWVHYRVATNGSIVQAPGAITNDSAIWAQTLTFCDSNGCYWRVRCNTNQALCVTNACNDTISALVGGGIGWHTNGYQWRMYVTTNGTLATEEL